MRAGTAPMQTSAASAHCHLLPTCSCPSRTACNPQIDLLLMSFSTSIAMITAITGLFAMNVQLRPDPMVSGLAIFSLSLSAFR